MKRSRKWETFLPISQFYTSDAAPAFDSAWCTAAGVNPSSEIVLRLLRDKVLPFVRDLQDNHHLLSYNFLVHDRNSGVPTDEKDHGAYIHLRLSFYQPRTLKNKDGFVMTRPIPAHHDKTIAGVNLDLFKNRNINEVWLLINKQSEWVLTFIEAHTWKYDVAMVQQVKQFGHFFCNMLQMSFR